MRLNTTYVLILSIVVLLFFVTKNSTLKEDIYKEQQRVLEYESKAINYDSLKRGWRDSAKSISILDAMLNNSQLKSGITKTNDSRLYKIRANSLQKDEIDYLLQSILTKELKIVNISITRLSDENASLKVDIEL